MAINGEREALWRERIEQWRSSGLSQRAFALQQGYPVRQVGYWVRRLATPQAVPALLPVEVKHRMPPSGMISLSDERGWTLRLPTDVSATWLAELLRAL